MAGMRTKKLMNSADAIVREMVDGVVGLHPRSLRTHDED